MSFKKGNVVTSHQHHYNQGEYQSRISKLKRKIKENPLKIVSFSQSFQTIISVVVVISVFQGYNYYFFDNSNNKIDKMMFWGVKALRPELFKVHNMHRCYSAFSFKKATCRSIFQSNNRDLCNEMSINSIIDGQDFSGLSRRDRSKTGSRIFSSSPDGMNDNYELEKTVLIAVGSNMGNRYDNVMSSLQLLEPLGVKTLKTSFLHETAPMYLEDQPRFLNGVIEIKTKKSPAQLLHTLKQVEQQMGRILKPNNNIENSNHGDDDDTEEYQPNGPRPIDLDILFYDIHNHHPIDVNNDKGKLQENEEQHSGGIIMNDENVDLIIPHPRIGERDFVLYPLADLYPNFIHPITNTSVHDMKQSLQQPKDTRPVRVIPLPRNRILCFNQTLIMGILNVTPDSFSGDGMYNIENDENESNREFQQQKMAVEQALQMQKDGADIIDIGGESTRPGAKEVSIQEEIQRTVPIIQQIRKISDIPISIDTRHADVAKAAIEAGADIVNDVSGGMYDPNMISVVSEHTNVPFIMMHSRGTPQTMSKMTNYDYDGVVSHVANHLRDLSEKATLAGIPRWLHIVDPGIGFAKEFEHNLQLLKYGTAAIHQRTTGCPILLGPSRKRFIGQIMKSSSTPNEELPAANERDYGTIAACIMGSLYQNKSSDNRNTSDDQSGMIFRVHNVKAMKQATMVMDAIQNA